MVTVDYEWVLVVMGGYGWLWVGNGWLPMATMVTRGYEWIWVLLGGFGGIKMNFKVKKGGEG